MTKDQQTQTGEKRQGIFMDKDLLKELITTIVQSVLIEQSNQYMKVEKYKHSPDRHDYRNGYKPRTINTRVGKLKFLVPQVRSGNWRPTVFDRYQRSEKAMISTIREMVIKGVSTRKVAPIVEKMAGFSFSASTVSKITKDLDDDIQRFRNRSLSSHEYPYLIIDARYEHIRHLGHIVSKAFLVIAGINEDGYREVLDFGVADSENEQSWGDLFRSLKQRGLHGTEIIVSDAHLGIQCAVRKHFQGVAWQRCRVHFARELVARVSFRNRKELTGDLKEIFATESKEESMALAEETASKWQNRFPKVSKILMSGIEDCLTYKSLPRIYQHRLSSTNMLERIMRECKRRSRVINIFPSDQSCIRYLGTLLIELHEEWIAEPKTSTYLPAKKTRYITMN